MENMNALSPAALAFVGDAVYGLITREMLAKENLPIKELNKKENITIIMVSHDIKSSVKYASHILHLNGDKTFFGTTDDYIKSPVGKYFFAEDIQHV